MGIALILISKPKIARLAKHVLFALSHMLLQIGLVVESFQTWHAHPLMTIGHLVLKVILEAPVVFESADAYIAEDIVAGGVVEVVL